MYSPQRLADDGKRSEVLEEARTKWPLRSVCFCSRSLKRERGSGGERIVGFARAEGWRMTGSAYQAMDVLCDAKAIITGEVQERRWQSGPDLTRGWRIAPKCYIYIYIYICIYIYIYTQTQLFEVSIWRGF